MENMKHSILVDLNKLEISIKNAFLETIKPIENKAFMGNS
jgi:hypothetical protein